jgi:hypothetical protein
MLYTIAVVLIILWLLGLVTGYTLGSFIHLLLVVALILVLFSFFAVGRIIRGRCERGRWASQGGRRDEAGENKRSQRGQNRGHELFCFHKTLHIHLCLFSGGGTVEPAPAAFVTAHNRTLPHCRVLSRRLQVCKPTGSTCAGK